MYRKVASIKIKLNKYDKYVICKQIKININLLGNSIIMHVIKYSYKFSFLFFTHKFLCHLISFSPPNHMQFGSFFIGERVEIRPKFSSAQGLVLANAKDWIGPVIARQITYLPAILSLLAMVTSFMTPFHENMRSLWEVLIAKVYWLSEWWVLFAVVE